MRKAGEHGNCQCTQGAQKSNRKWRASESRVRQRDSRVKRLTARPRTRPRAPRRGRRYLSSTLAPAPSSWALAFSASSLVTFSRTAFGALSTRSLASFETEAGEGPHLLDDLDLLVAGAGQDDVELVLLLLGGGGIAAAAGGGGGRGDGCGRGDAELVLELLQQLGQLEDGHAGDGIEDLFFGCHDLCSLDRKGGGSVLGDGDRRRQPSAASGAGDGLGGSAAAVGSGVGGGPVSGASPVRGSAARHPPAPAPQRWRPARRRGGRLGVAVGRLGGGLPSAAGSAAAPIRCAAGAGARRRPARSAPSSRRRSCGAAPASSPANCCIGCGQGAGQAGQDDVAGAAGRPGRWCPPADITLLAEDAALHDELRVDPGVVAERLGHRNGVAAPAVTPGRRTRWRSGRRAGRRGRSRPRSLAANRTRVFL